MSMKRLLFYIGSKSRELFSVETYEVLHTHCSHTHTHTHTHTNAHLICDISMTSWRVLCLTSKRGNKDKTSDHNFPLVSHSGGRVVLLESSFCTLYTEVTIVLGWNFPLTCKLINEKPELTFLFPHQASSVSQETSLQHVFAVNIGLQKLLLKKLHKQCMNSLVGNHSI